MRYQNPIIRGFNPDPSICRVGEDYYLVTSSFEYFPGLPIYHSTDLVNWKQIGNCLQRSEEFPLHHVKDSGGIWAPTIRYHEGVFYVTATLEQYGNFIVSTENPAGEWSAPIWIEVGGIDPSLLFEEGKVYYCTNHREHPEQEEITLEEIDIVTGKLLTEPKAIWSGIGGGFLEAPHVYHIGEWYYIVAAEGGTNFNHMVTVGRSKSIWGPYENCPWNPILTNVHDTSKNVQCAGHGDLMQDHNGNWWMVHLGTRLCRRTMSNLGRETFLTPVVWKEDWPFVENDRKAALACEGPLWGTQSERVEWKADFTKQEWESEIMFLRNPVMANYKRGTEGLQIKPSSVKLSDCANPSLIVRRPFDFDCEMETEFTFAPKQDGDEAGVVVHLASDFHVELCIRREKGENHLVLRRNAEDMVQVAYREKLAESESQYNVEKNGNAEMAVTETGMKCCMKVKSDKEKYSFYFCIRGEAMQGESAKKDTWQLIGTASTRFLCCEMAGKCFTGTVWGLYTTCEQETDAEMQVDNWRMCCM